MGKIWLGSLPQVLRDAGLDVDTYPGWETRSRSSGGYEKLLGAQVHHTASFTSPENDMRFMWEGAPYAPIGAALIHRSGKITVGAAGATNTSGRGGPMVTSKGTVPQDQGNAYLLSFEAANDGRGEVWPDPQLWAYVIAMSAVCRAYDLNPSVRGDLHGHFEYTSRKIDPAGPSWYSPNTASWNMTKFRDNVRTAVPVPPPLQGVPDVFYPIRPYRNSDTRKLFPQGHPGIDPGKAHTWGLNPSVFPANTTAVAMNIAVVPSGLPGWLMVWPAGQKRPEPVTSVVNYEGTGAHNGSVILGVKDLKFNIETLQRAHVILDITGYWTS